MVGTIQSYHSHYQVRIQNKYIKSHCEGAIVTDWFNSKLSSLGIILDSTGAGEAVAVVERKMQTVKQRIREIVNSIPYKLSEKLEGWLVRYTVSRIVLQPTRNSGEYTSPREKLYRRKVNVEKE